MIHTTDLTAARVEYPEVVGIFDRAPIAIADLTASELVELRAALESMHNDVERDVSRRLLAIEMAENARWMPSLFSEELAA
jgi:hypothetical protein